MVHKRNTDKLNVIKIKIFFSVKHPVKRIKNQLQIRKNISKPHIPHEGFVSQTHKEFSKLSSSSNWRMGKRHKETLHQKGRYTDGK